MRDWFQRAGRFARAQLDRIAGPRRAGATHHGADQRQPTPLAASGVWPMAVVLPEAPQGERQFKLVVRDGLQGLSAC